MVSLVLIMIITLDNCMFNFLKRRSLAPSHRGKSSPVQTQNTQTNGTSNALKAFCSPLTQPLTVKRTKKSPDENPKAKLRKPLSNVEDNAKVLVYVSNHVSCKHHYLKFRSEPKCLGGHHQKTAETFFLSSTEL